MTTAAPASAIVVLGLTYLVQGLSYGFFSFILVPELASKGNGVSEVALLFGLGGLPWLFKAALAWLFDARRLAPAAWLASLLGGVGLTALAMALHGDPTGHRLGFALLWLAHNVCLSLSDAATDTYGLDRLGTEIRGRASAVMLAAHTTGSLGVMALGVGVYLRSRVTSPEILVGLGVFTGLCALVVLGLVRRDNAPPNRPAGSSTLVAELRLALRAKGIRLGFGLAFLVPLGDQLTSVVGAVFALQELGLSLEELTTRLIPVSFVASLVGYVGSVVFSGRYGASRTCGIGTIALGATWLAFAFLHEAWTSSWVVYGMIVVQGLSTAFLYTGTQAVLMDLSPPFARATLFVAFTTTQNATRVLAPLVAAPLVEALGYPVFFAALGALQVGLYAIARRTPAWYGRAA